MSVTIYSNGTDFFKLGKSSSMVLTPKAAIEVCEEATHKKLFVLCVEGGHIIDGKFRLDMNSRWDAKKALKESGDFSTNNKLAIDNINDDVIDGYNAFVVTLPLD